MTDFSKRNSITTPNGLSAKTRRMPYDYDPEKARVAEALRKEAAFEGAKKNPRVQENRNKYHDQKRENEAKIKELTDKFNEEAKSLESDIKSGSVEENVAKMAGLKSISDELSEIMQDTHQSHYTIYDSFLEKLAVKNPRYILYINPQRFSSTKFSTILNKLSLEELAQLEEQLKNSEYGNLLKNGAVSEIYYKFFKCGYSRLSDLSQLSFYLSKYPENYEKVRERLDKIRLGGETIGTALASFLRKSPTVFQYFSCEDLTALANDKPNVFGRFLVKYPEQIDKLPENFFETSAHNPTRLFQEVRNDEVIRLFYTPKYIEKFGGVFVRWMEKSLNVTQ